MPFWSYSVSMCAPLLRLLTSDLDLEIHFPSVSFLQPRGEGSVACLVHLAGTCKYLTVSRWSKDANCCFCQCPVTSRTWGFTGSWTSVLSACTLNVEKPLKLRSLPGSCSVSLSVFFLPIKDVIHKVFSDLKNDYSIKLKM